MCPAVIHFIGSRSCFSITALQMRAARATSSRQNKSAKPCATSPCLLMHHLTCRLMLHTRSTQALKTHKHTTSSVLPCLSTLSMTLIGFFLMVLLSAHFQCLLIPEPLPSLSTVRCGRVQHDPASAWAALAPRQPMTSGARPRPCTHARGGRRAPCTARPASTASVRPASCAKAPAFCRPRLCFCGLPAAASVAVLHKG